MNKTPELIFLNGGPGYNSRPESRLLAPLLEREGFDFRGWNESCEARASGQRNFQASLEKACSFVGTKPKEDRPRILVAHSFAANYALPLLQTFDHGISKVVLITPTLDMHSTELEILRLAAMDMQGEAGPQEEGKALGEYILSGSPNLFDEDRHRMLLKAVQDPHLLTHYFRNKSVMGDYCSHFAGEYAFDLDHYCGVRASMPGPQGHFEGEVLVVFGAHDRVIIPAREKPLLAKHFPKTQIRVFEESSHYPHIEEAERFVSLLGEFANGVALPERAQVRPLAAAEFSLTN